MRIFYYEWFKILLCSDCGSDYRNQCKNCLSGETCCEECGKRFSSLNDLSAHKRKYHSSEKHICNVCQREFSCRVNLVRHQKSPEDNICYPCEKCPKTFSRIATLNEHTRKCINRSENIQTCNACGKKLSSKNLKRHEKLDKKNARVWMCLSLIHI